MTLNVNLPVLHAAIARIEAHPENHHQQRWRCVSGMCLFGTICDIDPDTEWLSAPLDRYGDWVAVNGEHVHCSVRAAQLLGLDPDGETAAALSNAYNTLDDIRRMAAELSDGVYRWNT
jgi:hypothetical protein